jgi:Plasmid encoded RepA protein
VQPPLNPSGAKISASLSLELIDIAVARRLGTLSGDVYQVAQALIICGLPYAPTSKTKVTRKARLGDGSIIAVTFSTALEGQLPYGSDRSLLHFILDRAVKTKSRYVGWETATEFLRDMNMQFGGKNRRDLRQRLQRIRGLTIGVQRSSSRGAETEIMPVIRRSHLPSSLDKKMVKTGRPRLPLYENANYGVELDEVFFDELMRHHVPVPKEIIWATRRQSQLQDLTLYLYWRSYAAENESLIPWKYLREQLWQDDTNLPRIKVRFSSAIRALQTIWPELRAEARREGLLVAPPRGRIYLTPEAGFVRRLS